MKKPTPADVDLLRCALPAEPDPDFARRAGKPFLRAAAVEALGAAREDPAWATPVLARWFRKARRLGSRDRKLVQAAVYGVIRHEHLLTRSGARDLDALVEGWLALCAGDRFEHIEASTPAEDYATALSLGFNIAREWLERLGPAEAAKLGAAMQGRAPVTVRANRLKCTRAALRERLAEEGVPATPAEHGPDALHIEGRHNLEKLASFHEGWFELQDESSQLFCEAIPLEPGDRVIDLCAGAGGKSLALAARGASVEAWDIRERALEELEHRAWRAGADVTVMEPSPAAVVVVDAPCSGIGRLRRDPALRMGLRPHQHDQTQQELLDAAATLVEPGGVLAYATCSLLAHENERTPRGIESLELVDERVLWPHQGGTDGFGWRVWRRGAGAC